MLCEEYIHSKKINLDDIELSDGPMSIFKIDIGMFPDSKYLSRNIELQDLPPTSPKRLRAIIIDHLQSIGQYGNCYSEIDEIYKSIMQYPLFYKKELTLDKNTLVDDRDYLDHFNERIKIIQNKAQSFFYLKEIYAAEDIVKRTIHTLLARPDHKIKIKNLPEYLENEANELFKKIPDFKKLQFMEERTKLITGALQKSFFIITGKPGSGKTKALRKIIEEIKNNGENVTVLAPTGKASLRLREATSYSEAKTIDRFIYSNRFADVLDDFENFILPKERTKQIIVQNLIIGESSMLDLKRIAILFQMLEEKESIWTKRIIIVGDENQLPPIGFGKPFYDIIEFVKNDKKYRDGHFVELKTNCRQKFDQNIIKVSELFIGGNRYYDELLEKISSGYYSSPGFSVELWKNDKDLSEKMEKRLSALIHDELKEDKIVVPKEKPNQLNLLLGLDESGNVKSGTPSTMKLDRFQLLSPCRAGYFGTLGLNQKIKSEYRKPHPLDSRMFRQMPFTHSEKIIRLTNQYKYNPGTGLRELVLSNGSIGVVCNKGDANFAQRECYFTDMNEAIPHIDDPENYDLAYAITVHKSQGSEFTNIFVVIPNKHALLSRELLYTALTRSTDKVTIFLQESKDGILLERARKHSDILPRMTSIFQPPEDNKRIYEPKEGKTVRSKIEYILYRELENKGIKFHYEQTLELKKDGKIIRIHPDFTIEIGTKRYFLEHLGMLDMKEYYKDWKERVELYAKNGLITNLITTDDAEGIKQEKLDKLMTDILEGNLKDSKKGDFSEHHYQLY